MRYNLTVKEKKARDMICLPLDMDEKEEIMKTVDELFDLVGYFKLNFAFTNNGPEIIAAIKKKGCKVFLDLKFHDIPNTVSGYARAATRMKVDMFNVHTTGGLEMMKAAVKAADEESKRSNCPMPKLVGVTILTSVDQNIMNKEIGIPGKVEDSVLNLALIAKDAGLNGIVCSAADLYAIKDKLPNSFMFVTPGVKGVTTEAGADQKRVFSPGNAVASGSSLLVVGRAITDAPDKRAAAYEILQDMAKRL